MNSISRPLVVAPAKAGVIQFRTSPLAALSCRSRESGNLGISVTCSWAHFRGGGEFVCPQDFLTAAFAQAYTLMEGASVYPRPVRLPTGKIDLVVRPAALVFGLGSSNAIARITRLFAVRQPTNPA